MRVPCVKHPAPLRTDTADKVTMTARVDLLDRAERGRQRPQMDEAIPQVACRRQMVNQPAKPLGALRMSGGRHMLQVPIVVYESDSSHSFPRMVMAHR